MFKKTIFAGFLMLSMISISTLIYAAQYYDQYPGNGFVPRLSTMTYNKGSNFSHIYHNDTSDESYICPVTFNVPDGSTYFIKSIGMRYKDDLPTGYLHIALKRTNLFTGNEHIVASWTSGISNTSPSVQTASQGAIDGKKLVDTKKFAYWLYAYFHIDGDVNPGSYLVLYQVRIHYGT